MDEDRIREAALAAPLDDDEALLAECEVSFSRAGGPGGQHVNRRETGVRIAHGPTGLVARCDRERSQYRNKQQALAMLHRKLLARRRRRPTRVPTSKSQSVRERILRDKRRQSQKKRERRAPSADE